MDLGLRPKWSGLQLPVDFSFFFSFPFFFFLLLHRPYTRAPLRQMPNCFTFSPARVQIPPRHRCKSTHTTLSCLLFPDSPPVMVNLLPPCQGFVNRACTGSICVVLGGRIPSRCDKCSFVPVWQKYASLRGGKGEGGCVFRHFRNIFQLFVKSK